MELSKHRMGQIAFLYLQDAWLRDVFHIPQEPDAMKRFALALDVPLPAFKQLVDELKTRQSHTVDDLPDELLEASIFLVKYIFREKGIYLRPMELRQQLAPLAQRLQVPQAEAFGFAAQVLKGIIDDVLYENEGERAIV